MQSNKARTIIVYCKYLIYTEVRAKIDFFTINVCPVVYLGFVKGRGTTGGCGDEAAGGYGRLCGFHLKQALILAHFLSKMGMQ